MNINYLKNLRPTKENKVSHAKYESEIDNYFITECEKIYQNSPKIYTELNAITIKNDMIKIFTELLSHRIIIHGECLVVCDETNNTENSSLVVDVFYKICLGEYMRKFRFIY